MALFYNTVTTEVITYAVLRTRYPGMGFSSDPWHPTVDPKLLTTDPYPDLPQWKRLHEVSAPSIELWEVVEAAGPIFNSPLDRWETGWNVRNMTQPELDALNASLQETVSNDRKLAYQTFADPLFFKSQRGETTSQEWLDKIDVIRATYPDHEPITIPES